MLKLKQFFTNALPVILVMAIAANLVGCSKDDAPPAPKSLHPFIQQFYEGSFGLPLAMYGGNMQMSFAFDPSFGLKSDLLYNSTTNVISYNLLLKRYNDTGITRNLKSEEKKYTPFKSAITRIQIDLRFKEGEEYVRYPLPDMDYLTIRFKSYYNYIQNGYVWPHGESEWHEMTIREFNETAPHYLVDVKEIIIKRDKDNTPEIWYQHPEDAIIWLTFDHGGTSGVTWFLSWYDTY